MISLNTQNELDSAIERVHMAVASLRHAQSKPNDEFYAELMKEAKAKLSSAIITAIMKFEEMAVESGLLWELIKN